MRDLSCCVFLFCNEFNESNNTGAQMFLLHEILVYFTQHCIGHHCVILLHLLTAGGFSILLHHVI